MNHREAEAAMKQGAIAAVICGVVNLLVMIMAMAVNAKDGPMAHFNDPWMLADVIVLFALAHFIHRQSRFAALTMFFYYLGARIFTWVAVGRVAGLPFTLLFLFFFGRAAWADDLPGRQPAPDRDLDPAQHLARGWRLGVRRAGWVRLSARRAGRSRRLGLRRRVRSERRTPEG